MDLSEILYDIPSKLVSLAHTLKDFLFSSIEVPGIGQVSMWGILAGVGIVALIVKSIIFE